MFLNTFHREHILLKLKINKLLRKIKSKNLTAGVKSLELSLTVISCEVSKLKKRLNRFIVKLPYCLKSHVGAQIRICSNYVRIQNGGEAGGRNPHPPPEKSQKYKVS